MTFFLHVFPTLCKTKFTDTFINFMTNAQIFAVVVKNFTLVTHRAGRELTKENLLTYDMYDVIITSFI